jgi:hypothetical protein
MGEGTEPLAEGHRDGVPRALVVDHISGGMAVAPLDTNTSIQLLDEW